MIWSFNPADLRALDLKSAKAGDILCALRSGATYELWLRLGGESPYAPMLNLTGAHALEMWNVRPQGPLPTLLIAEGPKLQLEISDAKGVATQGGSIGDLVITDDCAYLVAKVQENGFTNNCWISLATWQSVAPHEAGQLRVSFSTWRLVDNSEPGVKRIVATFGEWEEAGS